MRLPIIIRWFIDAVSCAVRGVPRAMNKGPLDEDGAAGEETVSWADAGMVAAKNAINVTMATSIFMKFFRQRQYGTGIRLLPDLFTADEDGWTRIVWKTQFFRHLRLLASMRVHLCSDVVGIFGCL